MNEHDFETKQVGKTEDVFAFYNEYAPDWDSRFIPGLATNLFHRQRFDSFFRIFNQRRSLAKRCDDRGIELGCGTGTYAAKTLSLFGSLKFIDGSQKMLDQLKEKHPDAETICADVTRLPIKSASVDVVYWFGLIEHILDRSALFREAGRILSPSGILICNMPNADCPWYSMRGCVRGTGLHCSTDKYMSLTELTKLAQDNGFVVTKYDYWGSVPAGINSGIAIGLYAAGELMRRIRPLARLLGGLTVSMRSGCATRSCKGCADYDKRGWEYPCVKCARVYADKYRSSGEDQEATEYEKGTT